MSSMAVSKSRTVKSFFHGFIPMLSISKMQQDLLEKEGIVIKEVFFDLLFQLKYCDEKIQDFLYDLYPNWNENRSKCITMINKYADEMDRHHRNINRVKLPAAGIGIFGGVVAITGLALTPVTFGASLGLTIVGGAITMSAGAVGTGAGIADTVLTKEQGKKADQCLKEHKEKTNEVYEALYTLHEALKKAKAIYDHNLQFLKTLLDSINGRLARQGLIAVIFDVLADIVKILMMIPEVCKTFFKVLDIISEVSMIGMISMIKLGATVAKSILPDAALTAVTGVKAAAKVGANVAVPIAAIAGYAGAAAGIGINGIVVAYTMYDIFKRKGKTEAAQQLRKMCAQLRDEQQEVKKVYDKLQEEQNSTSL